MPKAAQYALVWSPAQQTYYLQNANTNIMALPGDAASWFTWLSDQRAFAFHGQQGQISLLKESRQSSGGRKNSEAGYWYAYRRQGKRVQKRYVGRDADLTVANLEMIAATLNQKVEAPSSPAPAALGNKTLAQDDTPASQQPPQVPPSASVPLPKPVTPLLMPKLQWPSLHADLILRPRLLRQLESALTRRLTIVVAPAGFGKTTLVRQWLSDLRLTIDDLRAEDDEIENRQSKIRNRAVAWLALDAADNDPVRFWRYVSEAFQNIQPGLGTAALAELPTLLQMPFTPLPLETVLVTQLNALSAYGQPCLLVLEDYHLLTADAIHQTLAFFVEHLPSAVHVLLLTRSEPALPLARWRARNELGEITAADLRFSPAETHAFLEQATSLAHLSPAEQYSVRHALLRLENQVEGWAAGLRLLALTLEGQQTATAIEQSLATFAGSHRPLLDYFVNEVLNTLPASLQHFLLQISVLGRLTASLCDAVTGRTDSAERLATLDQDGLFLEPLGGQTAWYRFHPLFAEAMQHEARRRFGSEVLRTLADKASVWYEQQDLLTEAVETALRAPNFARVVHLIKQLGEDQRFYGKFQHTGLPNEFYTLQRWLEQLPSALLHQHPDLCLEYATALLMIHFSVRHPEQVLERIQTALDAAETGFRAVANTAKLAEVFAFRALLTRQHGELLQAMTWAQQALAWLLPTELAWRSVSYGLVAMGELLTGRLDSAYQQMQTALGLLQVIGNPHFLRATHGQLSTFSLEAGELHQTAAYLRPMLAEARTVGDVDDIGHAQLGLAQVAYEWNELAEAQAAATEALDAIQRTDDEALFALAELLLARIQAAQGHPAQAHQQLAHALAQIQPYRSLRHFYFHREIRMAQVRLDLATGDLASVQRWWTARAQEEPALPLYAEREEILLGRLLLAQGQPAAAVTWLTRLCQQAQEMRRVRTVLEIQVVLALAHAAAKALPEAKHTLREVITFTATQGHLRLFLDEGPAMAALLRALLPTLQEQQLRSYVQMILRAFAQAPTAPTDSANSPALMEPLTPQEERVLRQLATGRTNAAIARELIVSVNTIRTQVQSIYHKLGVNNRVAASDMAREMGLV